MERRLFAFISIALMLSLLIGSSLAGSSCSQPSFEGMDGKTLYERACATCHGKDGRAKGSGHPNYRGKRKDWDEEKLLRYIDDPKAFKQGAGIARLGRRHMPAVNSAMPEAARRKLVAHVIKLMDELQVD